MVTSTTAVPGEVEEVRMVVVVPFAFIAVSGVMSPSVVANLFLVQFTILPDLSVTIAVIVEVSIPSASMIPGDALREIAYGSISSISGIWYIWYVIGLIGLFGSMNWKLQGIEL